MDREVFFRPELRAAGFTEDEVRRMMRVGELIPVRRGAYAAGALPDNPDARHALLVHAAMDGLSHQAVVSHVSAAVLHRLRVWGVPLDRVHVTRNRRSTGVRRGSRVHVHCAPLAVDEVVLVDGVPTTSVPRTVADIARTVGFEQAVIVTDAALDRQPVDRAGLLATLERFPRWPGLPAARRAIGFADGGSKSVGESRSRVAIARAGLPAPVLQWVVRRRDGRFVGEVDFAWPELRTVGEFDGRVKYDQLLRPGETPADALYREKLREDGLRGEGLAVVRWGWPDLADFARVAERLRERFDWR
ncbi:hypothetical protein [Pseudonocardia nigra]|uniref:hypothetical protein n=1 Tax=Pseudonocardia nigra TaxID=1921578 RepID=UPI001C6073B6|nr:hypothetical protein [Pseudonocardia nigra]